MKMMKVKEFIEVDKEIDVHDYGICKIVKKGESGTIAYLVNEQDGSINWYLNPDDRSDVILDYKFVTFVRER